MKSGILKDAFIENQIKTIHVRSPIRREPYIVTSAEFDTRSRKTIFLHMTMDPPVRTNHIHAIRSYISDFKNTHDVYAINDDTDSKVHRLSSEYEFNKGTGILVLTLVS